MVLNDQKHLAEQSLYASEIGGLNASLIFFQPIQVLDNRYNFRLKGPAHIKYKRDLRVMTLALSSSVFDIC